MKFDWRNFTEENYNKYLEKCAKRIFDSDDYLGAVRIGDVCVELIDSSWFGADDEYDEMEHVLVFNFYVAHEDTGYGYKNDILPYDYAGEFLVDIPYGSPFDEFTNNMEELIEEYIMENDETNSYSLVEHANRPLEVW